MPLLSLLTKTIVDLTYYETTQAEVDALNRRRDTAVGTVANMEAEQAYLQYLERKGLEEYSAGGETEEDEEDIMWDRKAWMF